MTDKEAREKLAKGSEEIIDERFRVRWRQLNLTRSAIKRYKKTFKTE